jgi:hypothetical protein
VTSFQRVETSSVEKRLSRAEQATLATLLKLPDTYFTDGIYAAYDKVIVRGLEGIPHEGMTQPERDRNYTLYATAAAQALQLAGAIGDPSKAEEYRAKFESPPRNGTQRYRRGVIREELLLDTEGAVRDYKDARLDGDSGSRK